MSKTTVATFVKDTALIQWVFHAEHLVSTSGEKTTKKWNKHSGVVTAQA